MDLNRLINSFKYAWAGLKEHHRKEQNFRIQLIIGFIVIIIALILSLDWLRIVFLLVTSAIVLSLEILNSGLEKYIDKLTPQRDKRIGQVKDTLAGSVLLAVIFSIVIGIVIFFKPVLSLVILFFSYDYH